MKRIDRKILIFLLSLRLNGRAFLTTVALDEARRAGRMPLGLSLSELFLSLLSYLCLYLSLSLSLLCSPSVSLSLAVCLLLSLFSSLSLFISLSFCLSFSFSLSLSLLPPLPHSPFVSLSFLVPPSSLALFISLFSPFIHSFLSVPIKPVSSCTPGDPCQRRRLCNPTAATRTRARPQIAKERPRHDTPLQRNEQAPSRRPDPRHRQGHQRSSITSCST